jgi:hypothetical protein
MNKLSNPYKKLAGLPTGFFYELFVVSCELLAASREPLLNCSGGCKLQAPSCKPSRSNLLHNGLQLEAWSLQPIDD